MNLIFIEKYIQKIKKEDIFNFTKSQGITPTQNELDILYNSLKTNYKTYLYNKDIRPKLLSDIKSKVSYPIACKIDELYYQYKDKI